MDLTNTCRDGRHTTHVHTEICASLAAVQVCLLLHDRAAISFLALTLSDPGYFRQLTIRGGGDFKSPPLLRSRKLLCQSSPYHTCAFSQVF